MQAEATRPTRKQLFSIQRAFIRFVTFYSTYMTIMLIILNGLEKHSLSLSMSYSLTPSLACQMNGHLQLIFPLQVFLEQTLLLKNIQRACPLTKVVLEPSSPSRLLRSTFNRPNPSLAKALRALNVCALLVPFPSVSLFNGTSYYTHTSTHTREIEIR